VSLEQLHESECAACAPDEEVLAVHEALDALAQEEPLTAEIVKLRYFVGMTVPEVAGALGISPRKVDRYWAFLSEAQTRHRDPW
jgi:DNA-directed RNA polymerase specialized sigma24 family protein